MARLLRRGVDRLLGDQAPRGTSSAVVVCAICEHTCSPACVAELRRRRVRTDNPWRAPEVQAKARAARMRMGRPHAAALASLPRDAFSILQEPDRTMLLRYYGLDHDGVRHARQELADVHGWSVWRVEQAVARGVARLLARTPSPEDRSDVR